VSKQRRRTFFFSQDEFTECPQKKSWIVHNLFFLLREKESYCAQLPFFFCDEQGGAHHGNRDTRANPSGLCNDGMNELEATSQENDSKGETQNDLVDNPACGSKESRERTLVYLEKDGL